ncbi:hypothetical protein BH18THE2_BH18THE2_40720 [soil metagenome]
MKRQKKNPLGMKFCLQQEESHKYETIWTMQIETKSYLIFHEFYPKKVKKWRFFVFYHLRTAFSATLLSALNSTSCPPLFQRNSALMLPFSVTWFPVAGSGPVTCSPRSTV